MRHPKGHPESASDPKRASVKGGPANAARGAMLP